jgi:hypothetical protein
MGCQKSCALRREANLTGFERAEKALLGGRWWEELRTARTTIAFLVPA